MKKQFPSCVFLDSMAIGEGTVDIVQAAVEEASESKSWVDVMPMMPDGCGPEDAYKVLTGLDLKSLKVEILGKTNVIAQACLTESQEKFSKWLGEELSKQKNLRRRREEKKVRRKEEEE